MQKQTTIKKEVTCTGVGLHSGQKVTLKLKPTFADTGIIFERVDLPNNPKIKAVAENVTATVRATTLEQDGAKVFTIEHLMSALHVHKIDNCIVELNAEEPPVFLAAEPLDLPEETCSGVLIFWDVRLIFEVGFSLPPARFSAEIVCGSFLDKRPD